MLDMPHDSVLEFEESTLDDRSHAEMLTLYRESADTIRFAKSQQWKSLGATLLIFGALMVIAAYNASNLHLVRGMVAISLLLSAGSIYALVIYQVWQNTERQKLRAISGNLSSLLRDVRALKPRLEANIFRYLLLTFMLVTVVLGNTVVIADLAKYLS
ncbi:MAG: hypothetical protein QNJ67_21255 [Kiloniellales bacterium]|nr:hypothetical protein [Kiloniellales bacterium]